MTPDGLFNGWGRLFYYNGDCITGWRKEGQLIGNFVGYDAKGNKKKEGYIDENNEVTDHMMDDLEYKPFKIDEYINMAPL